MSNCVFISDTYYVLFCSPLPLTNTYSKKTRFFLSGRPLSLNWILSIVFAIRTFSIWHKSNMTFNNLSLQYPPQFDFFSKLFCLLHKIVPNCLEKSQLFGFWTFCKVSLLQVESLWGDCTFFWQIGGHSSRFVLFCSFWRIFTIKTIKSVIVFPFSFWKIIFFFTL